MLPESRRERIAFLARENRGRLKRSDFLGWLSYALGHKVTSERLLRQDATDALPRDLRAGYAAALSGRQDSIHTFFRRGESKAALRTAELLAKHLADEAVLLWVKQSKDCGAVCLPATAVFQACEAICMFDGDTVSVLSEDRTQGFIFDKNDDEILEAFEVILWGSRWVEAATKSAG